MEISATKSRGGKSRRKIKKNNKSVPMSNGIRNGNISNDDVDEETDQDNSASIGKNICFTIIFFTKNYVKLDDMRVLFFFSANFCFQ